jgi:hypothetical protein
MRCTCGFGDECPAWCGQGHETGACPGKHPVQVLLPEPAGPFTPSPRIEPGRENETRVAGPRGEHPPEYWLHHGTARLDLADGVRYVECCGRHLTDLPIGDWYGCPADQVTCNGRPERGRTAPRAQDYSLGSPPGPAGPVERFRRWLRG